MNRERLDLLIETLFDNAAREDERHDAAMYLGSFDDDKALNALSKIASNPNEDTIVLDAAGESIAKILVNRNDFRKDIVDKLTPVAKETADAFIIEHKPQWK